MAGDPDDVLELFLGFWISRTVMAAVEMGVFEALEGKALAPTEAGAALGGLAERPTRALLDTCVAAKLLDKANGRYSNSLLASRFLHAGSEYSLRNYVLDERWCWGAWGRLEDALRANAQQLPADEEGYHAFPAEFFYDFLHGHSLAMAERLADAVDLSGVRRIMDVGGGSGAVSIALCRHFPNLHAVVVDQEPVVARAARARRSGRPFGSHLHPRRQPLRRPAPRRMRRRRGRQPAPRLLARPGPEILARVAAALPAGGRLWSWRSSPTTTGPARRWPSPSPPPWWSTPPAETPTPPPDTGNGWLGPGFTDIRQHRLPGRMVTTAFETTRR